MSTLRDGALFLPSPAAKILRDLTFVPEAISFSCLLLFSMSSSRKCGHDSKSSKVFSLDRASSSVLVSPSALVVSLKS